MDWWCWEDGFLERGRTLLEQLKYMVELQYLVDKKAELIRVREETPRRIGELEKLFGEFEGEHHQKKAEYDNALKMRRSLEQEVKDLESKMERSKGRMHEIKSNREYQAMLKEIEDLKTDIRVKEDQILEHMETIDRLDKAVKLAGKDLDARRRQLDTDKEKTRQEGEMIAARLKTLETLEEEVRRKMQPDIAKRYDFLLEKRNGSGVAAVQEGACQLCHLSLPPQKYVELQKDEAIMNCPSCLRFIYWLGNDAYQVFPDGFSNV